MSQVLRAGNIKLKRAYEPVGTDDGRRILVDRLWPRGLKKTDAAIDHWIKDIAPSTELRLWFGHDPDRWQEFRQRYIEELRQQKEQIRFLRTLARNERITLIFSASDTLRNNAVVLRAFLLRRHPNISDTKTVPEI